ncbi:tumor protein p53-inducible protein 13 isoform X2 [Malaclemys terrapin pileata]|uniref:tumor protein p53-inducible protein 13 isoform X2 n=1 Tax=Malaclemys terrapin pileata TaxID=2991368 RepID=UPI0023A885F8|nr:tumor protein p53-inducible protein 13 isoform X2 [Malaclemys terrapin pileata]
MAALPWIPARPGLARLWLEAAPVCALRAPGRGARPACSTEGGVAFLDYPCPLPSLQARLVQYSLTLHSSVMQERALLKHPRPRRSRSVGGRPTAAWRGPHVLDKALPMPEGHLQPRSRITASSRNKSGSPTPELPGASVGPEHSQAGGGATLEPRGDQNHLDTAPASGSSLNTRATGGQHSAPMLPSTDALPQASATPGSVNGPAAPPPPTPQVQEGPGRLACSCPNAGAQRGAVPEGQAPQAYVPTPRTEEAAWAASALTFLLVVLTLAILYTRLHRKCRKSQSLYWAPGDAGQEPLAALLRRRLLSAPSRRKKRQRPQQRRLLLQGASSESSD